MHIGRDRNFEFLANGRENFAAFARADSTKGTHRCPVRLVVGRFEDKIDIFGRADFGDASRHPPNKLFRLDYARTENERRALPANCDFADANWFDSWHERKQSRYGGILKSSLSAVVAFLFMLVFLLGMLSMGLQLVASRVLAPFFGSSIFVWASLITTFLAAFSTGSFIGAAVSAISMRKQKRIVGGLMIACSATLLFNSVASYAVCDWLDAQIENLPLKLIAACVLLYFVPVMSLSSITPVCIAHYDRLEKAAGRSAGLVNGISTFGNIIGV